MFVRQKVIRGVSRHYLVHSVRIGSKVRQKVLAYLGQFDNVEDCFMNASGKRRARLARFRDPFDVLRDSLDREQAWVFRRTAPAPAYAVKIMLPRWIVRT